MANDVKKGKLDREAKIGYNSHTEQGWSIVWLGEK